MQPLTHPTYVSCVIAIVLLSYCQVCFSHLLDPSRPPVVRVSVDENLCPPDRIKVARLYAGDVAEKQLLSEGKGRLHQMDQLLRCMENRFQFFVGPKNSFKRTIMYTFGECRVPGSRRSRDWPLSRDRICKESLICMRQERRTYNQLKVGTKCRTDNINTFSSSDKDVMSFFCSSAFKKDIDNV